MLLDKKYKQFFNQVKQIDEDGVKFFEKVLELDIPESFNELLLSHLVMFWSSCLNSKIEERETTCGWRWIIREPYFSFEKNPKKNEYFEDDFNTFETLIENLSIVIFNEDKHEEYFETKEELYQFEKLEIKAIWQNQEDSEPLSYFLNE